MSRLSYSLTTVPGYSLSHSASSPHNAPRPPPIPPLPETHRHRLHLHFEHIRLSVYSKIDDGRGRIPTKGAQTHHRVLRTTTVLHLPDASRPPPPPSHPHDKQNQPTLFLFVTFCLFSCGKHPRCVYFSKRMGGPKIISLAIHPTHTPNQTMHPTSRSLSQNLRDPLRHYL